MPDGWFVMIVTMTMIVKTMVGMTLDVAVDDSDDDDDDDDGGNDDREDFCDSDEGSNDRTGVVNRWW